MKRHNQEPVLQLYVCPGFYRVWFQQDIFHPPYQFQLRRLARFEFSSKPKGVLFILIALFPFFESIIAIFRIDEVQL